MPTYTDVTLFLNTWPEPSVERRFVQKGAEIAYDYINSGLAAVYTVPFVTVPSVIISISDLLTRALAQNMVERKSRISLSDISKASDIDPVKWLENLASGKETIPGVSRRSDTGSYVSTADIMHVFDMDHEIYHEPDQDLLDTLEDEREAYP